MATGTWQIWQLGIWLILGNPAEFGTALASGKYWEAWQVSCFHGDPQLRLTAKQWKVEFLRRTEMKPWSLILADRSLSVFL